MTWKIGSGLGQLLKNLVGNKSFQDSAVSFVESMARKALDALASGNTAQAQTMFANMADHPQAVVGAIVKGTEAENLVAPEVVQATSEIRTP
jgi:fumarylacetoacetate (FAA) hydrolase family protein